MPPTLGAGFEALEVAARLGVLWKAAKLQLCYMIDCLEMLWGHPPHISTLISALPGLLSIEILALSLSQAAQSACGRAKLGAGWFDVHEPLVRQ